MFASVYHRAGIRDPELVKAYEACRRATQKAGEVEYAVSQLMTAPLRPAMWALYACGRVTDDLADSGAEAPEQRAAQVDAWAGALQEDLRRGTSTDPVRRALVHTLLSWNLPTSGLSAVFTAHKDDIAGRRIDTWEEWSRYSQTVNAQYLLQGSLVLCGAGAQVPFRLSNIDLGAWRQWLEQTAEAGGAEAPIPFRVGGNELRHWQRWLDAFSLTDMLMDLAEDTTQGRIMLPTEALDEFGVAAEDLLAQRSTPAVLDMVRGLGERAERWFSEGPALTGGLHPALTVSLETVTDLCRVQLRAVERAGSTVLRRRPALPRTAFLRTVSHGRARAALAWYLCPAPTKAVEQTPSPRRPDQPTAPPTGSDGAPPAGRKAPRPPVPHPSGARPPQLDEGAAPRHVAIIMDGNGRWATAQGLPRMEGHRQGLLQALYDTVHGALEIGLEYLTVYALSTENWKRPVEETTGLVHLFGKQLASHQHDEAGLSLAGLDMRMRWAGETHGLPPELLDLLTFSEHTSRQRSKLTLTLCVNYGGRAELTQAATGLAQDVAAGRIDPARVSEQLFARYLHLPDLPDVDLLLRTGAEQRTSNFLPWQAAYAELDFLEKPWPEFDRLDLWRAMESYGSRNRRYGAVPEEEPRALA